MSGMNDDAQTTYDCRTTLEQNAALAARVTQLETALGEIATPVRGSTRREIDQLRDAVRWRQGIARDVLASGAATQPKGTP